MEKFFVPNVFGARKHGKSALRDGRRKDRLMPNERVKSYQITSVRITLSSSTKI